MVSESIIEKVNWGKKKMSEKWKLLLQISEERSIQKAGTANAQTLKKEHA